MVSLGIVTGPLLGGVLIAVLSWHWIFLVNLPIGIVGTWMAQRFVPDIQPAGGQRFDFAGASTLFISLMGLLLGLTIAQEAGFTNPTSLALFVVWIVFLVLFIRIELRTSEPMIDLRLFRNRIFRVNLGTGFLTFLAISGTMILMPFYLENMLGYPIQLIGPLQAAVPVMLGILAPVSGILSDRYGSRRITVLGLLVLVIAYVILSTLSTETTTLGYILRMLPLGLGMGIFQSPNNSAVMGAVPRERLGIASGLLSMTRTLGQTVGIAVLGTIWAGQVAARSGESVSGGATNASAVVQVAAMRDTIWLVVGLLAIALAIAVWAWWQESHSDPAEGEN
jgi:MFS family permease